MTDPDPGLRAEFDALTARAGLVIPPERQQSMFESFLGQRRLLALLHQNLAYTDEPAFVGGGCR